MEEREIHQENRKIRFLRFLVDLSITTIQRKRPLARRGLEDCGGCETGCLQPLPRKGRDI